MVTTGPSLRAYPFLGAHARRNAKAVQYSNTGYAPLAAIVERSRMGIRDHAVHYDSPTSRKADWHSFRRAFATALAEAGANEQTARNLVAQGDASVHARHVQQMRAMQHIPEAAVPLFGAFAPPQKVTAVTNDQTGKSRSPEKEARPVRFELTTSGFEGRRSIQLSYGRV